MTKTAMLMCVMAASAMAQYPPLPSYNPYPPLPSTYNPALGAAEGAQRAASEAYRAGLDSRSKAAELKVQQGWLDLARQQALAQQQAGQGKTVLGQPNEDIKQALLLAHMTHADFDALVPLMQIVAEALRPDWSKLKMSEYLECLYVIAKNASFAATSRDQILSQQPPAAPPK